MRAIIFAGVAMLAGACTPPQTEENNGMVDMGPMPVVAGLYDSGPLTTDREQLSVWFSDELATALAANAVGPDPERLDFDYRSWANDPEVEDIRYAIGQHADQNRSEVSTRFTYPGVGGGMNLTWNMCRLPDGQWRIDDITAVDVGDEASPGAGEVATLRTMLGLETPTAGGCA